MVVRHKRVAETKQKPRIFGSFVVKDGVAVGTCSLETTALFGHRKSPPPYRRPPPANHSPDQTDPETPRQLSALAHVTSCDPVVAQGNYAYGTRRAGSFGGGGENRLDILDITDLTDPQMDESYAMQGPFGLGIDDSTLFVCDGRAGLKVYDVTDPANINLLAFETANETYDVILIPPLAIVVGPDGLHQYDYTDVATTGELVLLSHLDVVKPPTMARTMR